MKVKKKKKKQIPIDFSFESDISFLSVCGLGRMRVSFLFLIGG